MNGPRQLLGTISLVQDIMSQRFEISQVRAGRDKVLMSRHAEQTGGNVLEKSATQSAEV